MGSVIRISPPISTVIVSDASDLVLGHVTGGILTTAALEDEQTITTANSKSSTIRINFYDMVENGVNISILFESRYFPVLVFFLVSYFLGLYSILQVMTANCKRVSSRNNLATNGVIHVVEELLQPVTKSLTDIVSSNPQLSYLKTGTIQWALTCLCCKIVSSMFIVNDIRIFVFISALGASGISHGLRLDGQFTLLAPTDNAFRKLDGQLLNRILADKRCLKSKLNKMLL